MSIKSLWPEQLIGDLYRKETGGSSYLTYKDKPKNIYHTLVNSAEKWPRKTAVVAKDTTLTYRELLQRADETAAVLSIDYGIKKGDNVALIIDEPIDFVIVCYALLGLGSVAVVLNSKLTAAKLTEQIRDSRSVLAIAGEKAVSHLEVTGKTTFEEILSAEIPNKSIELGSTSSGDIAIILYTSGTTGIPKAVMISNENALDAVINYRNLLSLTGKDSTVIGVPLFYVTGLIAQLALFIFIGGTTYLSRRFNADEIVDLAVEKEITFIHASATVYKLLAKKSRERKEKLESFKIALCGGSPCSTAVIEDVQNIMPGVDFRTVYGLSESSSPVSLYPAGSIMDRPLSAGLFVPTVEYRVVDRQNNDLPSGEPGELLIRGGNIIKGYWKGKNKEAFNDGWFRTGDIVRIDDKGYLFILDRKKDMINRGGEKVYSIEVEKELESYDGVKEAAVIGVADELYGQEVMAYIVPADDRLQKEDILRQVQKKLPRYKQPKEIEFLPELPRNKNGKILKKDLQF